MPARIVVDRGKVDDASEDELGPRGEAPDRLRQEIKRAVADPRAR